MYKHHLYETYSAAYTNLLMLCRLEPLEQPQNYNVPMSLNTNTLFLLNVSHDTNKMKIQKTNTTHTEEKLQEAANHYTEIIS